MAQSGIPHLRTHVSSHPGDARSMALLANLLVEEAKSSSCNGQSSQSHQQEAISLAKASIELSPDNAVGYAVLSTIPDLKFRDRMSFLRTAVDLEQVSSKKGTNSAASRVAIATSLSRLLIEPREEMARDQDRLAAKNIMRQGLSVNALIGHDEGHLYVELKEALESAKSMIWARREERWHEYQDEHKKKEGKSCSQMHPFLSIPPNIEHLAKAHYRLGSLFRTMKSSHSTHNPKSEHHFRSVLDLLHPPYMHDSFNLQSQSSELHDLAIKSKFWSATLQRHGNDMRVDRCPSEYIVSLYSTFAANFDNLLVNKLKYQTPAKLRHRVDGIIRQSATKCFNHGADLGCGTGLSGVAFRDLVEHLSGIDLSPEMVAKARERKCYDLLSIGDVESIFADRVGAPSTYDLIVACDVFVYIGDLRSVFKSVAKHLSPKSGLFAFSTELLGEDQGGDKDVGFVLQACARFAHTQSYVRHLAKDYGFLVKDMAQDVIRRNGGKDVVGILAILSLS